LWAVFSSPGPETANGIVLLDTYPQNVALISTNPNQGSGCSGAQLIACNIGTLSAGSSANITIIVSVGLSLSGTITNHASVSGNVIDLNTANNIISVDTTVTSAELQYFYFPFVMK